MPFNTKIKDLRLARGLTQSEVANGIVLPNNKKLSASSIGMYEQGRRKPSFEVLEAFADYFNVDLNTLHDLDSENTTTNKKDKRDIQKRLQSILDDLDSSAALSFYNGEQEMDEDTKNLLRISLENSIRLAKERAKQKFTPNKYKK